MYEVGCSRAQTDLFLCGRKSPRTDDLSTHIKINRSGHENTVPVLRCGEASATQ